MTTMRPAPIRRRCDAYDADDRESLKKVLLNCERTGTSREAEQSFRLFQK